MVQSVLFGGVVVAVLEGTVVVTCGGGGLVEGGLCEGAVVASVRFVEGAEGG